MGNKWVQQFCSPKNRERGKKDTRTLLCLGVLRQSRREWVLRVNLCPFGSNGLFYEPGIPLQEMGTNHTLDFATRILSTGSSSFPGIFINFCCNKQGNAKKNNTPEGTQEIKTIFVNGQ